jgi:hypothetical protein
MPTPSEVAHLVARELGQYLWEGERRVITDLGIEAGLRVSRVAVVDDVDPVQLIVEMTNTSCPGSVYAYDAELASYRDYLPDDPKSAASIIGLALDEVLDSGAGVIPDVPVEGGRTWVYLR